MSQISAPIVLPHTDGTPLLLHLRYPVAFVFVPSSPQTPEVHLTSDLAYPRIDEEQEEDELPYSTKRKRISDAGMSSSIRLTSAPKSNGCEGRTKRRMYACGGWNKPSYNIDDCLAGLEEYQIRPAAGIKRRASSPPPEATREDRSTTGGNTVYHQRPAPPVPHFQMPRSSFSPGSSFSQRNASFASSYGFSTASSMTSYSEDWRFSPGALSPSADVELGPIPPYAASRSLNPSPRGSLSRPHHQQSLSGNEQPHIRKMSMDSVHSVFSAHICECCPKKPKKFDNEEELR